MNNGEAFDFLTEAVRYSADEADAAIPWIRADERRQVAAATIPPAAR